MSDKFKFDVVIGNPPYQEELKGTSDRPIFHLFMDEAYRIAERVSFITPARFLFNAGKTPKSWNNKMLNDKHLKVVFYEQDASNVFADNLFEGGVAITYRDAGTTFGAIGCYTAYQELNDILQKVTRQEEPSINTIMHLQNKFNMAELYSSHPKYKAVIGSAGKERRLTTSIFAILPDLFSRQRQSEEELTILGLLNSKRVCLFISRRFIEPTINLDKYKIIVPKSNGASGTLGNEPARIISMPELGEPTKGFTQSFIGIGAFDTLTEAEAAFKYVKSKFARIMLGILKVTQDNSPDKWKHVPIQDFTPASDIDWSQPIHKIDQQLYEKYGLDQSEIDFIESHVREMG